MVKTVDFFYRGCLRIQFTCLSPESMTSSRDIITLPSVEFLTSDLAPIQRSVERSATRKGPETQHLIAHILLNYNDSYSSLTLHHYENYRHVIPNN